MTDKKARELNVGGEVLAFCLVVRKYFIRNSLKTEGAQVLLPKI